MDINRPMDNDHAKSIGIAISLGLIIFSALTATIEYVIPDPTITKHTVETVGFVSRDGIGHTQVISIDTGDEVLTINQSDTDIVKTPDDSYKRVVRDYHESIRHINDSPNVLYVPEEHAYALSQSYTQTFGETLVFKTED